MREYSTSLGGILSAMASAAQPMGDPYQVLKVTGEWNSKTTEDYIAMCKAEITGSKEIQQDLAYISGQWRDTVVREIGRERYDELSEQLGGDLAYAYMDYRVEELMIDRLVKERMPKSSADYIIRKAAESSLLGLSQTLNRSPLAEEIEARGEAAYRPKGWEKGAGRVLGATADTVMMGGVGSWATLAKFVGADVAISAVASRFEPEKSPKLSVEQCISKGVFGSERNVFTDFRKEAATVQTGDSALTVAANEQLKKKIPVMDFSFSKWMQTPKFTPFQMPEIPGHPEKKNERAERYKDVPLIVAPGQEEAYLKHLEKYKNATTVTAKKESTQPEMEQEMTIPMTTKGMILDQMVQIFTRKGCHVYACNAFLNHVHILVEIPSPTDFAKIINKVKSSTGVVYRKYPEYADFSGWAAGFDSFSVSFNDLNRVKHHIEKQETVHQELSFEDEYDQLLEENGFNAYQDFMRASFSAYAAVNNHIKNKRK